MACSSTSGAKKKTAAKPLAQELAVAQISEVVICLEGSLWEAHHFG